MSLFEELATATAPPGGSPGGILYGYTPFQIMDMFQCLADHDNARPRYNQHGRIRDACEEIGDAFERDFRRQYRLSRDQYHCVSSMFDRHEVGNVREAYEASMPKTVEGVDPVYVRKCFVPDLTYCCGRVLRVSKRVATLYGRDQLYSVWNLVKFCKHGCKRRYFFDKTIVPDVLEDGTTPCFRHVYLPWKDGNMPQYIASRSGKSVVETNLLTSVAANQVMIRSDFQSNAEMHNLTIRHGKNEGTPLLTGAILLECWAIFAVLKHKQDVGPWVWVPPEGQKLKARQPKEVTIVEVPGEKARTIFWPGLMAVIEEVTTAVAARGLWSTHSCNGCRKDIEVDGEVHSVNVATVFAVTSTGHAKCKVKGCKADLPERGRLRFCVSHGRKLENRCSVTEPPCPNMHEKDRWTCRVHSPWEDRYRRWNNGGNTYAHRRKRRAGKDRTEPAAVRHLRSMFSLTTSHGRQASHGHLVSTFHCGTLAGIAPLWEEEDDEEVERGLNETWPHIATRPTLMFYDRACSRRKDLLASPDPRWAGTINLVDRFHIHKHEEADCVEYCSPERQDDPLLWHLDETNTPIFNWSPRAVKSNKALFNGLAPVIEKMPRVLGRFVLTTNMLVHNEMLFDKTRRSKNPKFQGFVR